MPKIIFKLHNGQERAIETPVGFTVMETAVKNAVAGIDADCGGACACATCHVYVDERWLPLLPPRNDMEHSMLDFAEGVRENSRLACQIKMSDKLDGLTVQTPASQH